MNLKNKSQNESETELDKVHRAKMRDSLSSKRMIFFVGVWSKSERERCSFTRSLLLAKLQHRSYWPASHCHAYSTPPSSQTNSFAGVVLLFID